MASIATSTILERSLGPKKDEDDDGDVEDFVPLIFSFEDSLDRRRGINPGLSEALLFDNLSSSPTLLRKTFSIDPKYNAKTVHVNVMTL